MRHWKMAALVCVLTLCASASARAADYYVAVDGADTNPGTLDSPFATLKRAEQAAAAGDTVYLRGGVYRFSGTQSAVGVSFTKSGAADRPIRYFAYEGETPIFDLFELKPQERVTGLDLRCSWVHLRGLEVRGVRQIVVGDSWGVRIRGDHNVVERLNVHDNQAPGIFITSGKSNRVLNCDSHHNYDPLEQGGNADGFGCHSSGGDNILSGCRAWENSDDGYDFINAAGTCIAEGSWAFRNGYIPDTNMTGANGAGFKSGGYGNPPTIPATGVPRHVVRKSLAFGNRAIGFYANYHPGGIDFLNNTAFDNPANYDMRTPSTGSTPSTHKLRNNIAAGTGRTIVSFNGGTDTFNSWTLSVEVTAADFVSLDKALGAMPRKADGSLPDMALARLAADSDLIDRGEDVGLAFTGKAPDLGAHEWGEAAPSSASDAGVTDPAPSTDAGRRPSDAGSVPGGAVVQTDAATRAPTGSGTLDAAVAARRDGSVVLPEDDDTPIDEGGAGPAAVPGEGCGCQVRAAPSRVGAWGVLLAGLWLARRARARRAGRA